MKIRFVHFSSFLEESSDEFGGATFVYLRRLCFGSVFGKVEGLK
jgi:hypothetical protein